MSNWYEHFTVICFSKLSHAFHENIPDRWKITWSQKNRRLLPRTEAKGTSIFTNCSLLLNEICIEISISNAYFRVCMPAPEKFNNMMRHSLHETSNQY